PLGRVLDGIVHQEGSDDYSGQYPYSFSPARQAFDRWFLHCLQSAVSLTFRHWLLLANLVNGLTLVGAVAAPLLMAYGWESAGSALFTLYSLICAQNPEHSYFLLGHQLAMDQRMMAIYGASLAAGLAFVPMRGRLRPIPWRLFGLMALPMAMDGFTQLLGWRHSSWELRTVTGGLFGVAVVWLMYPFLDRQLPPLGPRSGQQARIHHAEDHRNVGYHQEDRHEGGMNLH
ncbi:MAG TPA: DUF2085 domain-containing protein, partial [Chloroflexota bacterium]|nr:DUF2085 domain-containing protein [Chloroflexota bacterium]